MPQGERRRFRELSHNLRSFVTALLHLGPILEARDDQAEAQKLGQQSCHDTQGWPQAPGSYYRFDRVETALPYAHLAIE